MRGEDELRALWDTATRCDSICIAGARVAAGGRSRGADQAAERPRLAVPAKGGEISLEESVYLGDGVPRRTEQIVVRGGMEEDPTITKWRLNRTG